MSETQPQKRFVSKGRYVKVMVKATYHYLLGTLLLCLGVTGLIVAGLTLCGWNSRSNGITLVLLLLTGGLSVFPFLLAKSLLSKADSVTTSIAPITDRNTHHLPLQDTLVRASDLPPTEQPSELLRASQTGQETPPEELLRVVAADE